MRCHETRELLSLYIDHVLDEDLAAQVSAHLDFCPECRKEYEDLVKIIGVLSTLPEVPVPEDLENRWRMALERAESDNRGEGYESVRAAKRKRRRQFSAVCAVFVVGIFAVAMYNNSDQWIPAETGTFDADTVFYAEGEDSSGDPVEDRTPELQKEQIVQEEVVPSGTVNSKTVKSDSKAENQKSETALAEQSTPSADRERTTEQPVCNLPSSQEPKNGTDESCAAADLLLSRGGGSSSKPLAECSDRDGERTPADIRDSMAICYYMKVLERKLAGTNFEILLCQSLGDGCWSFDVELVSADEEGNQTESEIVTYYGQDGTIWKEEL